jgi:hypothetical protein
MRLLGYRTSKVRPLAAARTTVVLCILSFASCLPSAIAGNENQSQDNSQKSIPNPSLDVCVGKWHGHILNKEENCNFTANIKEKNGQLEGTATSSEKEGTCKHYFCGTWDSENHVFILKDIGLDIVEGASSWYPDSFDKYSLRLVDDKLVGTCHQSDNNKTSWIKSQTRPWLLRKSLPNQEHLDKSVLWGNPTRIHPLIDNGRQHQPIRLIQKLKGQII